MTGITEEITELEVTYFTDPLCCWSWGMQPHLDNLQAYFHDRMTIKFVMGGLLPSWTNYIDQVNSVSRPAQMGPVWMHAAQLTHRSINHQLWVKDPPSSSYPACIAVKSAGLQSSETAICLFKKLQQAAMEDGQNIANVEIIHSAANSLSQDFPLFDQKQFTSDFMSDRGIAAFRQDLTTLASRSINRFPSLVIGAKGQRSILIPGYRTLDGLLAAIGDAFPINKKKNDH